jgi:all-trans-8'-apo-beta-carotenal 15,15'-oxygenase
VLALAEGGPPVEINPETLDTLNDVKYTSSFFSAHPKIDPDTKSE